MFSSSDKRQKLPVPEATFAEVFRYRDLHSYADQLERLYSQVPWDRVKVEVEDLARDAALLYSGLLKFLSLPPLELGAYPRLTTALTRDGKGFFSTRENQTPTRDSPRNRSAVQDTEVELTPRCKTALGAKLVEFFREDITRTSALIGRDLSAWFS